MKIVDNEVFGLFTVMRTVSGKRCRIFLLLSFVRVVSIKTKNTFTCKWGGGRRDKYLKKMKKPKLSVYIALEVN